MKAKMSVPVVRLSPFSGFSQTSPSIHGWEWWGQYKESE